MKRVNSDKLSAEEQERFFDQLADELAQPCSEEQQTAFREYLSKNKELAGLDKNGELVVIRRR